MMLHLEVHTYLTYLTLTSYLVWGFFSVDDHSRVVLNSPGYDGNGYIHANYIEACIK